ncbi:MAG: hypothetical protein IH985_07330 [Planctomycetes bacterium]|nr:hypothetical protein [Planctomycetota bacterium]
MKVVLWLLAVLWPMAASGQTVFFDDFEGNALLPHWIQPPPSNWEHTVSNSMLNVTGLFFPGNPHLSSNFEIIDARYAPQTDFRIDVRMGWEQGAAPHGITFFMWGAQRQLMASFGYHNVPGSPEVLYVGNGTQVTTFPAPPPGMYQFAITRVATEFKFFLEGNLIATFPDNFGTPASGVSFFFLGPNGGQLGPLHIDRIRIVPAPGSILVSMVLLAGCARRKRHTPLGRLRSHSHSVIPCTRRRQ